MRTIASQLPIDICPTDDEEIEVTEFSPPCPHCRETLTADDLKGTVKHDTIKKLAIHVKCSCAKCGEGIDKEYRLEVQDGKLVALIKTARKWNLTELN